MNDDPHKIFQSVQADLGYDPTTVVHRDPQESTAAHDEWLRDLVRRVRMMPPEEVPDRLAAMRKKGLISTGRTQQVGGRPKAKPRVPAPRPASN
jgi:hypothetical protein